MIYTRLVEGETLIEKGLYFLRINKFFGVKLPWFWGLLKLGISLGFDKKYFGIIQRFQRQRSMIYYLQIDDDLLTFSYFQFLYV